VSKRDKWNARYAARDLVWSAGPNRLLAENLTGATPGSALDLACGEGRNALWLAEQGWQVSASDFSDVAIEKARQIADRRGLSVDWAVADISEDAIPERAYDLVCVLYLHTDSKERSRWLGKAIDAVKPGGIFLYIGHDPSNIEHGVGGPQHPDLLPGIAEFLPLLVDFRIETAAVVDRPVETDPGHGKDLSGTALDTFIRAVRTT
jgi:SAM-dependent methyltransferase